jgi:hypothetical protein
MKHISVTDYDHVSTDEACRDHVVIAEDCKNIKVSVLYVRVDAFVWDINPAQFVMLLLYSRVESDMGFADGDTCSFALCDRIFFSSCSSLPPNTSTDSCS